MSSFNLKFCSIQKTPSASLAQNTGRWIIFLSHNLIYFNERTVDVGLQVTISSPWLRFAAIKEHKCNPVP